MRSAGDLYREHLAYRIADEVHLLFVMCGKIGSESTS